MFGRQKKAHDFIACPMCGKGKGKAGLKNYAVMSPSHLSVRRGVVYIWHRFMCRNCGTTMGLARKTNETVWRLNGDFT